MFTVISNYIDFSEVSNYHLAITWKIKHLLEYSWIFARIGGALEI